MSVHVSYACMCICPIYLSHLSVPCLYVYQVSVHVSGVCMCNCPTSVCVSVLCLYVSPMSEHLMFALSHVDISILISEECSNQSHPHSQPHVYSTFTCSPFVNIPDNVFSVHYIKCIFSLMCIGTSCTYILRMTIRVRTFVAALLVGQQLWETRWQEHIETQQFSQRDPQPLPSQL
jgi:hypothetical protein